VDVSDELGDVWIASKWTGQAITEEARALYGMAHAKNRAEFNEASQYWHTLAQNMVYADIDGNIGIRPTGRVPIRASGNGALPYDGSKGEGGWTGYVAFDDLPHSENPDQHYLVSANQIVAGPSYPLKYLQNEYAAGYRARRINEVLSQAESIGIMGMIDLQYDINSSAAHAFTPYLINAIENSGETKYDDILTEIKNWTYKMDKDLAAPTIYRKWRDKFTDNTFDDEFTEYGGIRSVGLNKLEWLMKVDPNSHWFDNIGTTTTTERRDDIILEALDDAIEFLEDFYGSSDPSTWKWGDLHKLQFDSLTGLDSLSKGPYEAGGEGYTVTPSRVNIEEGVGYARGGSSERIIVDFNDLNNSRSCIPSGQRAISSSKHYADQLERLFLTGKYHKHWFANIDPNTFPQVDIESRIYFVTSLGGT
jgi:penicillin amidase